MAMGMLQHGPDFLEPYLNKQLYLEVALLVPRLGSQFFLPRHILFFSRSGWVDFYPWIGERLRGNACLSTLAKGRAAVKSFKDRYRVDLIERQTSGSHRIHEGWLWGSGTAKVRGAGRKRRKWTEEQSYSGLGGSDTAEVGWSKLWDKCWRHVRKGRWGWEQQVRKLQAVAGTGG